MTDAGWEAAVRARLFERRVVSVFGRLDDVAVSEVAAELWTLDALGDEPVTVMLSTGGGTVDAATVLVDVLDVVGVEVRVVCLGTVSGPPVAVLAGAVRRSAAPNARIILCDEGVEHRGAASELETWAAELYERRRRLYERLAASTAGRHTAAQVEADVARGLALSAVEALSYGLVDEIAPAGLSVVR